MSALQIKLASTPVGNQHDHVMPTGIDVRAVLHNESRGRLVVSMLCVREIAGF